jgi:hypothetical protein
MNSLAPSKAARFKSDSLMWKRQKKLEGLREELTSINLFDRLYESRGNPTELEKEVLAEIARLEKRKK